MSAVDPCSDYLDWEPVLAAQPWQSGSMLRPTGPFLPIPSQQAVTRVVWSLPAWIRIGELHVLDGQPCGATGTTELFAAASAESGLGTFTSGLDFAGAEAWAGCVSDALGFKLFGAWLGAALTVGPAVAVSGLGVSL